MRTNILTNSKKINGILYRVKNVMLVMLPTLLLGRSRVVERGYLVHIFLISVLFNILAHTNLLTREMVPPAKESMPNILLKPYSFN